jgi:hypothetical protein
MSPALTDFLRAEPMRTKMVHFLLSMHPIAILLSGKSGTLNYKVYSRIARLFCMWNWKSKEIAVAVEIFSDQSDKHRLFVV